MNNQHIPTHEQPSSHPNQLTHLTFEQATSRRVSFIIGNTMTTLKLSKQNTNYNTNVKVIHNHSLLLSIDKYNKTI